MNYRDRYGNKIIENNIFFDATISFPLKQISHGFGRLFSLPLFEDEVWFLSKLSGHFQCYDREDGKLKWEHVYQTGDDPNQNTGKFIVNEKYVVLGRYRDIVILDRNTGETLNAFESNLSLSGAIIQEDNLSIRKFRRYTHNESDFINQYNLPDFKLNWSIDNKDNYTYQLLKKDNYLYYWYDEFLYCHNSETGEELWKFDVGEIGKYLDAEKKECKGSVSGYPVFYGNTIIFQVSRNRLISLDYKTGQLEWNVWIDILNFCDLLIENNLLHAVGGGKSSYWYLQINPETGEVLLKKDFYDAVSNFFSFQPTLFTNTHFILSDAREKTILAIDRNTFENVWEYKCQHSLGNNLGNNSPTIIYDKLYQLDSEGNLYVFEQAN